MARTVLQGGSPLQLWRVSRLYAELYSTWPSSTPSETWGKEVIDYTLPGGKLGNCLDGSLALQLDRRRGLPEGFTTSLIFGTRCTLLPFSRLVRIIAVLPNGDEVAFHAGVLGLVKPGPANSWSVQLIAPDAIRRDTYVANLNLAHPLPAVAPYSGSARVYGAYSTGEETISRLTTYAEWWQAALATYPDAELGVGPDMVWLAGRPSLAPGAATYALDARAQDVTSQGREVPPYLTHIRRWAEGDPFHLESARGDVGLFVPRRSADVSGSITSTTTPHSETWTGTFSGGVVSLSGVGTQGGEFAATLPTLPANSILQAASVRLAVTITAVTGPVDLLPLCDVQKGSGFEQIKRQQFEVTRPGTWTFDFPMTPDALKNATAVSARVVFAGVTSASQVSATVSLGAADYKFDQTTYATSYGADPPGLDYPLYTEESWTLRLPGIHRGPLGVSGLPGSSVQYATTVLRANVNAGIWTELRCGPLPYQYSPISARPGRGGVIAFQRLAGKVVQGLRGMLGG